MQFVVSVFRKAPPRRVVGIAYCVFAVGTVHSIKELLVQFSRERHEEHGERKERKERLGGEKIKEGEGIKWDRMGRKGS